MPYRSKYTPEMDAIVKRSKTPKEAAEKLGLSIISVRRRRAKLGMRYKAHPIVWLPSMDRIVLKSTVAEAAAALNIPADTIKHRRKALGFKRQPKIKLCPHCGKPI